MKPIDNERNGGNGAKIGLFFGEVVWNGLSVLVVCVIVSYTS